MSENIVNFGRREREWDGREISNRYANRYGNYSIPVIRVEMNGNQRPVGH